jgi:uncharacterized protein (TIGR03000 family)
MIRLAVLLTVAIAPPAWGQGLKSPYVPPYFPPAAAPVPLAAPFAPVSGFAGSVRVGPVRLGMFSTAPAPFVYPMHALNPYAFGWNSGFVTNVLPAPVFVPPLPAPSSEPLPVPNLVPASTLQRDLAEAAFTAKLDLAFPAPAEVTFDGRRVEGSDASEVTLTSPPLKVGASHTFNVRAVWSVEGKKYRVERTVTVKAGERSRLTIVSGDPVK